MSDDDDPFKWPVKVNDMWAALGQQIADAIPDIVIGGEPQKAIAWAACAEACFWKATGDADTHDVKDILGGKLTQTPEIANDRN